MGRHTEEQTDAAESWTDERSRERSEAVYGKALKEAAAIANLSFSNKFEENRRKTWDEFREFIGRVGHGLSVEAACDLDVIAFVQGVWLPGHLANCRT
jgi:hypothetical protein